MVDLGPLAVSHGLCGRHRLVRAPVDGQFERGAVICVGIAKGTNHYMGIDRLGEGQELYREVLLGLAKLRVSCARSRGSPGLHTTSTLDLPFSLTVNG